MGIFKKEEPSLKDWQLKLINGGYSNIINIRVDEFIEKYTIEKLSEMDETTFKYCLQFHTKFSYNEQCDVQLDRVFEGVYDLDIPNADYLSYYLVNDDGTYYLFSNKCGRASFMVYKIDQSDGIINYDENSDKYTFIDKNIPRGSIWDEIEYVFSIRLKNVEFIHEFLQNFLDRNIDFKKGYKREQKIKQLLTNKK